MARAVLSLPELHERLAFVEDALGQSWNARRQEQAICREFGVGVHTARKYIAAVRKGWTLAAPEDADAVRRDMRAKLEDLYERCLRAEDYRTAERIIWRLGELRGAVGSQAELAGAGAQVLVIQSSPEQAAEWTAQARARLQDKTGNNTPTATPPQPPSPPRRLPSARRVPVGVSAVGAIDSSGDETEG